MVWLLPQIEALELLPLLFFTAYNVGLQRSAPVSIPVTTFSMELLALLFFVTYIGRVAMQCSSVRSLPASIMARQPPQTEAMELLPLLSVMVLSSLMVYGNSSCRSSHALEWLVITK